VRLYGTPRVRRGRFNAAPQYGRLVRCTRRSRTEKRLTRPEAARASRGPGATVPTSRAAARRRRLGQGSTAHPEMCESFVLGELTGLIPSPQWEPDVEPPRERRRPPPGCARGTARSRHESEAARGGRSLEDAKTRQKPTRLPYRDKLGREGCRDPARRSRAGGAGSVAGYENPSSCRCTRSLFVVDNEVHGDSRVRRAMWGRAGAAVAG